MACQNASTGTSGIDMARPTRTLEHWKGGLNRLIATDTLHGCVGIDVAEYSGVVVHPKRSLDN